VSDKTLILHWGTCAIAITRLSEIPEDLTEETPIVLVDGNIRQPPIGRDPGREITEYVCYPEYWTTDPTDIPETLPDRPPWAKQLINQLFRAIDAGDLALAKSLVEIVEGAIDFDEPQLARADVLIRRKEILGR
jgi:hypothetical protein